MSDDRRRYLATLLMLGEAHKEQEAEARPSSSPDTPPNPGAKPSNPESVVRPVRVKGKREHG